MYNPFFVKVATAGSRAAFLALVKMNFTGMGRKLYNARENPQDPYGKTWGEIIDKWKAFGGSEHDLNYAIDQYMSNKDFEI